MHIYKFIYIFALSNSNKQLKQNKMENTKRKLMLELMDVKNTLDAFKYALKMMIALKQNKITNEQYELLANDLQIYCAKEGIKTRNEIASLF
jgi:hypothetical protein